MSVMTIWALVLNQLSYGKAHNMLLQTINFCILVIAVWIAVEGVIKFFEAREAPPQPAAAAT